MGRFWGRYFSFADFLRVAPPNLGVNLPLAVSGFFENGGQQCFISQIAPNDPLESGLAALDQQVVSIVCCPDDPTISNAAAIMAAHCEKRKDRICILQTPQAVVPVATLQPPVHSSYPVFYYPWITVLSLNRTSSVTIPPCGYLAGVYAETDNTRGVWTEPNNVPLMGATALSQNLTPAEVTALNALGVDVIQTIPARGMTVTGNRTTSPNPNYQFIAVRRLMIFVEQSISHGTQWAVLEPNSPALWVAVSSSIQNFLTGVWRMGGLKGATQPEAFFVRCDLTTTTQNDINLGIVNIVVGFAPLKPAEFVVITIQQMAGQIQT